jgi:hypothetical protein
VSPRTLEPESLRTGMAAREPFRKWAQIGRRVVRRVAARRTDCTVFVDAGGVVAWSGDAATAPSRHDDFEAWALLHRESSALLLVSAHLLHTLRLDEVANAGNVGRLRLAAAQRMAVYHGAAAALWPVAVGHGTAFACALHGISLAPLVDIAGRHGIHLRAIVPLWSETVGRAVALAPELATSSAARLLFAERGLVTCMTFAAGDLLDVQHRFLEDATGPALDALVAQLDSESALAVATVVIAGWGIEGAAAGSSHRVLGALDGGPEDAAWLFAAAPRERN